jgi:polyhydroxyalkanoate synthesis repressor PhaR
MARRKDNEPVIIRKYANRRLYNTETSTYITLEELRLMVKDGVDFVVQDAKTGEDLTRPTLAQIIFEQETKGFAMLPTDFLRKIVGYYDDSMSEVLQHYLMASMNGFVQNQDKMKNYVGKMGKAVEGMFPVNQFEEMTRNNIALFEKTFSAFNPFATMFNHEDGANNKRKK